jgi:hypothetical protein
MKSGGPTCIQPSQARGHAERWPEWTEQHLSDFSLLPRRGSQRAHMFQRITELPFHIQVTALTRMAGYEPQRLASSVTIRTFDCAGGVKTIQQSVEKHLRPTFGTMLLGGAAAALPALLNSKIGELSPSTLKHLRAYCHRLYAVASMRSVRWWVVPNPINQLKLPKFKEPSSLCLRPLPKEGHRLPLGTRRQRCVFPKDEAPDHPESIGKIGSSTQGVQA